MYRTKQREELLEYLESIQGVHFTVSQVCEYFKEQGRPIATATLYRQLEKMVGEGLVNKYIIDANSPACFEYSPKHIRHGEEEICFHCKCEKCGKLIHMHCEELTEISGHMKKAHQFIINPMRTVFYGVCKDCAERG